MAEDGESMDLWAALLRQWQRGWPVIRSAPWQFIMAVLITTGALVSITITLMMWGYGRELASVRAERDLLQARNTGLDAEVKRFQDQAVGATAHSTNPERKSKLRQDTLMLVGELREFVEKIVRARQMFFPVHATSSIVTIGELELPIELALEYERRLKVRARVLRDLMLYELPLSARDEVAIRKYDALTIQAITTVASDLERLARLSDVIKQ